jgi:hypothetical protein
MPLTDAASDARRDDVVAAASNKQTDKQKKVLEWVSKISLDDIVFSETEWIKLGRDEEQKTRLQSVKGLPSSQLTVFALTRLCVQFRISGYKDKAKHVLCELIVNAVKANNLDAIMYPNDFGGATVTAMNDGTENETASTKKKKKDKKSKPAAIQQEGTFYRVIVTYFLQDVRPYVIKLGSQPNKSALDKRELLHQPIFDKLAEVYNDESRNDLKSLPYTHEMYAKCNVHANIPSKFDPLTARDISESLDFINYNYRISMQNCRKSGSHDDFHNFVRNKPYLLTYHQCLGDAPIELKGLASSELDESVKRVTMTRLNKSKGATSKKKNKKQRRTGSKQDKLTSAAKKMANVSCLASVGILFLITSYDLTTVFVFFLNCRPRKSAQSLRKRPMLHLWHFSVENMPLKTWLVCPNCLPAKKRAFSEPKRFFVR